MKTNDLIALYLFGTFLVGCGGSEETTRSVMPRTPATPVISSNSTSSELAGTPDINLSGNIYAGNSVSFQVGFISGYDAKCVDGTTPVIWKVIGDSTKITISDTDKCHPTITTTATFDGVGTVQGTVYIATESPGDRLIRYTGTLGLKHMPSISNLNQITGTEWTQKVGTTNQYKYARPLGGQNAATWIYAHGYDAMFLRSYVRTSYSAGLFGKILYEDGHDRTSGTRTFEFDLKNASSNAYIGRIVDPEGAEDEVQYSMDCRTTGDLLRACPFQFEAIDSRLRIVKMSLKGTNLGVLAGGEADFSGLFGVENVFNGGFSGSNTVRTIEFVLSMRHPHSKDVVQTTIATMKMILNVYY